MKRDPFWKRSSFGTLLYTAGAMLIGYLVGGRVPTEEAWLVLLGHALIVAGYQATRPTGPVK